MEKIKTIIPYMIILVMASILILMSSSCIFGNVGLFWDASVYLNVSKSLTQGKILYKDIVDNKGPILYFINYIALKLGGEAFVCIVEFIFIYVALLFLYKSIELINNNKFRSLIVLSIIFIYYARFFTYGVSCEEYALTFSAIAMYECIKFFKENAFTNKQCLLIGFLFGLVFLIRANLVVVFVGFGIGIGINLIIEKRFKELFKYILMSFIGLLLVCIPTLIYLLANNCFYEFIENVFILNTSMNKIGVFKSIFLMAKTMRVTFLVIFIYLITSIYKICKKEKFYISSIILIIVTLLFNSISKEIYFHYFIAFLPILMLAYDNVLNIICNISKRNAITYCVVICIIVLHLINYKYVFRFNVTQPNQEIIEYIKNNTASEAQIAVIGFYDEIYYLSNREPVSRITYVLSNNAFAKDKQIEILNQYFGDIINKKPEIIIEDKVTVESIVKKYIDIKEYEELKTNNYVCINETKDKMVFQLQKN